MNDTTLNQIEKKIREIKEAELCGVIYGIIPDKKRRDTKERIMIFKVYGS